MSSYETEKALDIEIEQVMSFKDTVLQYLYDTATINGEHLINIVSTIIGSVPTTVTEFNELINCIPPKDVLLDTVSILCVAYFNRVKYTGFSVQFMDDILMLIFTLRFIILVIRYNLITSFKISAITLMGTYVWYQAFINAILMYEHALYKNVYTFRLGVDATEIQAIMRGQVLAGDYKIRVTNPVGILLHAIGHGSMYENHRIDPISMVVANLPNFLPKIQDERFLDAKQWIIDFYYLIYLKIIPFTIFILQQMFHTFSSYILYTYMVRVGKPWCPYFLRWHWTTMLLIKFIEPFPTYVIHRLNDYTLRILQPQILEARRFGLSLPRQTLEISFLTNMCFIIIICHLSFMLYGMLHAICGQYFYLPVCTENVEMHIGKRDPEDIYSGGYTAWQDENPDGDKFQLWYGWFGRGTKKPFIIFALIRTLIYRPVYRLIKGILGFIKLITGRRR